MKNVKKVILSLFIIFFFSFFSHNAISATTIEDTTFPADVGKIYTWKSTYPPPAGVYKFTFKSESIEKGVHNSIDALIVNCTWIRYTPIGGWQTFMDNELYMAANNTQNYLVFEDFFHAPVIIPTPINLTLVAEASMYSYSIVDNTIIEDYGGGELYEYTYNTKGFLTSYLTKWEGEMNFKFVLATGGGPIPFGNFFLIFTVISVIALVYLKKQKFK